MQNYYLHPKRIVYDYHYRRVYERNVGHYKKLYSSDSKKGPRFKMPDVYPVIWEHGRRNYALRADGILAIVCPISDDTEIAGIGIFNADVEQTKRLMDGDPAVAEGVLNYEIHPTRSFPGDELPK